MQIHELKPEHKFKKRKRVGRGGKRGTYSGKGNKGQRARSGGAVREMFIKGRSSWLKRIPKLGGFSSVYLDNILVKTSQLEEKFNNGDEVNWETLKKAGLVDKRKRGKAGKEQKVKILNDAVLTKKLVISDCLVSKSVKEMIEKAGGEVKELEVKPAEVKGKQKETTSETVDAKKEKESKKK